MQVFTPQDYAAGDQNWAISQGDDNKIYIANNNGLLEYNGANWTLYKMPDQTIVRSVEVIEGKVYTGSYMDFGFWERDIYGVLTYNSLVKSSNLNLIEDEEIWKILGIDNWVLFQSFDRIHIYNRSDKTFKVIESDERINKIYDVSGTIYFQKTSAGIYKIENGREELITQDSEILNKEIVNLFSYNSDLLIQTKENGFYIYDGNVKQWNVSVNNLLQNMSIYSSTQLNDGSYLLGTISNGMILINPLGKVLYRINQANGLSNNTVLSTYQDKSGNIWLGLDNGINLLNLDSPYRVYKDNLGVLGTIYASISDDKNLYLGTNQGLFYRKLNLDEPFDLVEGTKGQVWNLTKFNETIFCGHDKGTFVIENGKAKQVADVIGTWIIKPVPGNSDLLLQGNYKGLNVLAKDNEGNWSFRNKITGFDISSRYIEFLSNNELLISHEYKGVYRLQLDDNYTKVLKKFNENVDKGIYSSLVKYNDEILYVFNEGVFRYNSKSNQFEKDDDLSELFNQENFISGKTVVDKDSNRLWGFSKDHIFYIEPGKISDEPSMQRIFLPSEIRKSKSGYENLLSLDTNKYLIGSKEGYLILDLDKLIDESYRIQLNSINYQALQNKEKPLELTAVNPSLNNTDNNIRFAYSVPEYDKFLPTQYQYRLDGIYNDWSTWSHQSNVFFENLPAGEYTFQTRAMVNGNISSNIIEYPFIIKKPWYLSIWAIVGYVLVFVLVGLAIQQFNKRHYERQQKRLLEKKERQLEVKELESQRQIMGFKNENLRQDIENKNRELGISTMNLINKNELLGSIKKELSNIKNIDELKSVIRLINENLNTSDDWKLFEEAFNNADKDFLKKVKTKHPSLTSNDLRLCTYLRLNLSSKEIAPLLNISSRSVEVKRYRLRKKMELEHKKSLTNYILEL
ncbi:triple tyrosine motif-containing protein [Winogradskyella ursingii]|uniref:triple tyrosine motif-containing protein n=1 Tax=Winogradskyella ursingii TaxID=2686079 RepID=UPI001FE49006|nr:triple tyrosine motif-containing protein [Winogradskyella ursingii]